VRQTGPVRVLFASTQGAGHFHPLVPLARACAQLGHGVLVAGPPALAHTVQGAGFRFWEFDDPPEDVLGEVWSRVPSLSPDEQNAVVIREIFARLDATASLPRLRAACDEWQPDVVVRDPNEYGSALAAELHAIPHARAAIGLSAMEDLALRTCADVVDELRVSVGLSHDPDGETLRRSPYLTAFPASLEDPAVADQPHTSRFRDPAWAERTSDLPRWWNGGDAPLAYVTFGSVAGGMPMAAHLYAVAMEAVAELPVRVLLTVGRDADLEAFADAPTNVRVEPWVPQADVLAHAAVVVCHGGAGSTLGALAAGLPLVVVPLFADQPGNARRVAAVGAGITAPPDPAAIRDAVRSVLDEESFRRAAGRVAAELRQQPPVDAAVGVLAGSARDPLGG
jgi:UDP:flavonoid glycosyltransferase YjiC (YdhE family)